MDAQSTSFRYGFYLDTTPDDQVVNSLKEAEIKAKSLSLGNGGGLVAIWQNDRVVRLIVGSNEFVPIKL